MAAGSEVKRQQQTCIRETVQALPGLAWGIITRTDGGGKHAEALPAAETGEAEQGQPSKYASGPRPAPHIWATATRGSAPIFTRALCGPQGKLAKRKRF